MNLPTRLVATGLFSGYAPIAPGTAGTAVALAVYCIVCVLPLPAFGPAAWASFLVTLFLVGVYAASAAESAWGDDPAYVVVDEFVGFFATVFLLPPSIGLGIAAFFIFRMLDIVKPPPARQVESLPRGWGVVMDDVVAGFYGNLILRGALAILRA